MTDLRIEPYEMPSVAIGPENPLPSFRDADDNVKLKIDKAIPQDETRRIGWELGRRVLPYRMQDEYGRIKQPRKWNSIVLENENLRATFLPELGGRLISLFSKTHNRELVERNPVFQPANLALRNAWFSGGVEWNTSQFGHYYLTCSPIYAARIAGPDGPILRLYEWDRVKCFPWQIDFHLPPGSNFLFARVRLINPHDRELSMYWWSNIAVAEAPGVRVLAPADTVMYTPEWGELSYLELPILNGYDATYPTNMPRAREMFFRILPEQRKWITALDSDGKGLIQTSTARLRGRKMYVWGQGPGGHHWQEFLSVKGKAYVEIQAGLGRTQTEMLPMPAREQWTWTEAYGYLEADPKSVHGKNWHSAWQAVSAGLERALPEGQLDALHLDFSPAAARSPEEILAHGSGWGGLERRRVAKAGEVDPVPCEFRFNEPSSEQEPWLTLLETGVLPEADPQTDPGPPMIQPAWRKLLEQAMGGAGISACQADKNVCPTSNHWLAWLHLGVMKMEAHDDAGAKAAWKQSLKFKPNAWALRNLAVLAAREKQIDKACELYRHAWECGPRILPIAIEYAQMLLQAKRYKEARDFINSTPESIRGHERLKIASAAAGLELGNLDGIEELFSHPFAMVREGEVTLTDIWFSYHEGRIAAAEKIPINEHLKQRVRKEFPPPPNIDFRMSHTL